MTREIILTQGKVALVDDEDFEELNKFKWHAIKSPNGVNYYAGRTPGSSADPNRPCRILMHNFILGSKGPDYKDRNALLYLQGM